MPTDHRAELKKIQTFPSLVRYLRDEMGWPINGVDFEEWTFEYTAEELGIDKKNAAKIDEIKRLRPLSAKQPWGIFFVKFEPKKLPVLALRRILSRVALKKRASANSAERAAWAADDLLFVSNYGEGDERKITFAHFSRATADGDLPILKVLGWDDADTALHLDGVADVLTSKLVWPRDEENAAAWREQWRSAFTLRHGEVVRTSRDLSIRLAVLAKRIRKRILKALSIETERGPLTALMKAFQAALIHDLGAHAFADMYAQTIAYGLLSARIANPKANTADHLAAQIPVTNPFLKELMETFLHIGGRRGKAGGPGIDFDELGVSEVVELLDKARMEAVVRDFGDKNPQEDPVIHFYELFLKEYDAEERIQRGVFYTPRPVVSYIVRAVDELLCTEFALEQGLADTTTWGELAKRHKGLKIPDGVDARHAFVQVLDPAVGTGTFLVEVIDLIHRRMTAKWKAQGDGERMIAAQWNEYVPKHLLPRLHGYELLMAPYAIAHLKIGLKLYETGYRFVSHERARIYLTNSLEPASDKKKQIEFKEWIPALAHEAEAVNTVKRHQRFTVVIGNPPYAGHSTNIGDWITSLVDDYHSVDGKPLGEKNPKWLQDDYVKFIRLAQLCIAEAGVGVLGYISNHGYIDNPTFRGMRQALLTAFGAIDVLDLHGSTIKRERAPDGSDDMNVFDIKQGVAILSARRFAAQHAAARVRHADLFGSRERKYAELLHKRFIELRPREAVPASPFYLLIPQDLDLRSEYEEHFAITTAMPVNVLGFQTHRDHFAIDFDKNALLYRIAEFRDRGLSDLQAKEAFSLSDNRDWNVKDARRQLRQVPDWKAAVRVCSYRPFDDRPCYFSTVAMDYPRRELQDNVAGRENLCLGVGRQGIAVQDPVWSLIMVSRHPIDANIFRRGGINVFPLYLYPREAELSLHESRRVNLAPSFLAAIAARLGLTQVGEHRAPKGLRPEAIIQYMYAVLHSPSYRTRYAQFLKIDFPRLPLAGDRGLFDALTRLGGELVALHLLESPGLDRHITQYHGPRAPEVEKVSYGHSTVWLDNEKSHGFRGVPEAVWGFPIGGYQVCEKWLKDRKGRTLSQEDIVHYQKIVVALAETIRVMKEIDEVIEQHGGWPGAFQAGVPLAAQEPEPLRKVAEPRKHPYQPDNPE